LEILDDVYNLDVDRDGDIDVVTCEKEAGMGVIWFENPTVRRPST